jgi:hypothetical protein|tara:strand:+ start:20465 stop:21001 length:537 start_codon:yes stop_codon:yes gene_type:complete
MFIINLLKAYIRFAIFATGILIGIQVPSFVDQYAKRIDAHYQEVSFNISGFQKTANSLFGGDLEALIAYYDGSNDTVFRSDSESIRLITDRYYRLENERLALGHNALVVAMHVLFAADQEFFQETLEQYTYTVPLNSIAIEWGLAIAIFSILIIDLLYFGCTRFYKLVSRRKAGMSVN